MTVGIVIQARMGSSRMPEKVLKDVAGRPLLDHVLGRLGGLRYPAEVVVATTDSSRDDAIVRHCAARGVACFRGNEEDVLARYLACAEAYGFDHLVRLTADNPFTDIAELDRLIALHLAEHNDYTHAFGALPVGVGAEIFSRAALEKSARDGHAPNHREHVNEYVQEHPELFRIGELKIPTAKIRPDLRLTVDTPDDHARAVALVQRARGDWLTTEEAIALLCSHSA